MMEVWLKKVLYRPSWYDFSDKEEEERLEVVDDVPCCKDMKTQMDDSCGYECGVLCIKTPCYDDVDYVPINNCPWCGAKIIYKVIKTVREKEVKRTETVTRTDTVEEVVSTEALD